MIFLGIDTSNYTTSVYAVSETEIWGKRKLLKVKSGERGIRQSEGVFAHMKNFPILFKELCREIDTGDIDAVGVSVSPRSIAGSYMPVFLVGEGYAETICTALNVPLFTFSHQEGHIMAGIRSAKCFSWLDEEFLSVHISGGTTEILKTKYRTNGFCSEIIGGTKDISAGQFIDRIGVAMGLPFPAGAELEKIADNAEERISLPIKTNGAWMNLSGVETKAQRLLTSENKENLAKGVLYEIKKALVKTITAAVRETGITRVLVAGGVASNSIIRNGLTNLPYNIKFASKEYSSDNAMGIAELARRAYGSY